jgi:hypothetical protein
MGQGGAVGIAGQAQAGVGAVGSHVLLCFLLWGNEPLFQPCFSFSLLVDLEACPAQTRNRQEAQPGPPHSPFSPSRGKGPSPSFAFQNLYLSASSLNKSQLHLCPKLQVACLSLDFHPVWGGEELLPEMSHLAYANEEIIVLNGK